MIYILMCTYGVLASVYFQCVHCYSLLFLEAVQDARVGRLRLLLGSCVLLGVVASCDF